MMRKILKLSTLAFCLTLGAEASELSVVNGFEHDSVINIVEKQRTLIQEMNQELIYAVRGINPKENRTNFKKTATLFEKVLKGLIHGDRDLAILGSDDKRTLTKLNRVMKEWENFKSNIRKSNLKSIAESNILLLKDMNSIIKVYADIGQDKDVMRRAELFEKRLSLLNQFPKRGNSISQFKQIVKIDVSKI